MNQLIPFGTTMTSREIADLVESRHDKVKQSIERLSERGIFQLPPLRDVKNHQGQSLTEYLVGKRESYIIVAQLSPEFTARLVDRWEELEAGVEPAFKIPTTLAGALQLAADQAKLIEEQSAALEAAQPALQMVDRYIEAKSSKCLSDVAKILQQKPQAFIKRLADDGVIFKRSGSWVPFQQHIDNGRFTVKTGESSGHAYHQTRVEPAGIEWLARRFGSAA